MKFRIGDNVRVRKDSKYSNGEFAGMTGKVVNVIRRSLYPYDVQFENGNAVLFHANELEKVE